MTVLPSSLCALLLLSASVSAFSLEPRALQCTGTRKTPYPKTYVCNQIGRVTNPSVIQNTTAASLEACENLCFNDQPRCISLSYGPGRTCTTYNKNILGSNFVRDRQSGILFFNRKCFNISCTCTGGQTLCNNTQCVDTTSDPMNCGRCGNVCDEDSDCSNGTCLDACNNECPQGTTCGREGGCIDSCFNECPQGTTCDGNGNCLDACHNECPQGTTCDGDGTCVDACNNECPQGLDCNSQGQCVDNSCDGACPPGTTCKRGSCVDACNNECPRGTECNADGQCVGTCNGGCPGGQTCQNNVCTCSPQQSVVNRNACFGPGFLQTVKGTGRRRDATYADQTAFANIPPTAPCQAISQCAQLAYQDKGLEFETYYVPLTTLWQCNVISNSSAKDLSGPDEGNQIPRATVPDSAVGDWYDYNDVFLIAGYDQIFAQLIEQYNAIIQTFQSAFGKLQDAIDGACQQAGVSSGCPQLPSFQFPDISQFIPNFCPKN